jgi:flagellar basal-body rod protein FlgF
MDNAMYVGLSKQMILRRELDVVANNIANASTTGFKVESVISATDPLSPAQTVGGPQPVQFAIDAGLARDFSQGALETTGAPLDVAIEGKGFFRVSTASGERYTRDGRFTTNAQGQLVTQTGDPVLDVSGSPITLNANGGPPSIGRDGSISQTNPGSPGSVPVGRLGVVNFDSLSGLSKQGDGLYSNTTSAQPTPAADAVVHQGMLEASNVKSITQITDLIRISRAYDSVNAMMNNTADLSNRAIQRLGSVQ